MNRVSILCACVSTIGCREPVRTESSPPKDAAVATVVPIASTLTNASTSAKANEPPAPLRCLERYYEARAVQVEGRWALELPNKTRVPYDSGEQKTFEQKLASPDVKDVFSIAYRKGAIVPVSTIDDDPGRIRLDVLFRATYGGAAKLVEASLVVVKIRGQALSVHRRAASAFRKVGERLDRAVEKDPSLDPYLQALGGTFIWRDIAGTNRQSSHSYGVSLDINPALSHYWRSAGKEPKWVNKIPQAIVDAFEAEGFIWGGRWFHYDTMHFEWRPELLDASCRP